MDVRLPDGTIIRGVPDGMSKADLTAKLAANGYDVSGLSAPAAPVEQAPQVTGTAQENIAAGFGGALVRGGRAIKQAMDVPAQALERAFGGHGVSRALGMPTAAESAQGTNAAIAEAKELDKPLLATGGGKIGDIAGSAAMFAPTVAIPGANSVTGAALIGGVGNALTTSGGVAERGIAGSIGAVAGGAGQAVGQKIGQWASNKMAGNAANVATRQSQNTVRDATLREAAEAGYVVPPSTSNPTVKNRILESVSGKAQTQQAAAVKNQQVTNTLARQALGIPEGTPLTTETLYGLRSKAGEVYAEIASSGRVIADQKYTKDILDLSKQADRLNIDFPNLKVGAKDEIVNLTNALSRPDFDASSLVELVKSLRADAASNLHPLANNPAGKALGKAQLKAADAAENQLMRAMAMKGRPDLADKFDQARTLIAKTYSVQNALNESSGNVIAANLGKQMKKGKYLSDGLDTAGKFAQAFPKAAAEIKDSAGVSALDAFGGMGLGVMTGNPLLVAAPAAGRMATRAALLSGPGQKMLAYPGYQPSNSLALRLAPSVGQRGGLIGAVGVRESPQE
jgi:hypothetical protein